MQNDDLDTLFTAAARTRAEPSAALFDRVLADAYALQPVPTPVPKAAPASRRSLLARLAASVGGGRVLAGVCSAALAGVTLGYLNPASYDYLTGGLTDTASDAVDLFPTSEFLSSEG